MFENYNFRSPIVMAVIVGAITGAIVMSVLTKIFPNHSQCVESIITQSPTIATPKETNYSDEETATIEAVEKTNGAVVSIVIKKDVSKIAPQPGAFPFDQFFDIPFPFNFKVPSREDDSQPSKPEFQRVGGGSGFIIQPDGLIVTNKHVVVDEKALFTVILSDGKEYEAKVLAKDPVLDVALIDIEVDNLPTLNLGDSDTLKIGQTVIAIGNVLAEYGNSVTRGVVSGVRRRVEAGDGFGRSEVLEEAIQTDAAINPGNSGGPLLNLAGQVVGINTAVSLEGQTVGFAIPINSVKKTIESVQKTGRIVRPWLGVRYQPVTPRLAELNKLPITYGVLIIRGASAEELAVIPGSPADKAGLEENDIVFSINGQKLEDKDSLAKLISQKNVGDTITLKILRQGKEKEIEVKLDEFPAD